MTADQKIDPCCNDNTLRRSLDDQLTQQQEEELMRHLSDCVACRTRLDSLAADRHSWYQIRSILREENWRTRRPHSDGDALQDSIAAAALPGAADLSDELDGRTFNPPDFSVDFLEPSLQDDSLGRLGNIEILGFIGQGAHGVVLRGYQRDLNRIVAVKVMAPHLATVAAARKRFAREARAAAAIVHAHVMPILQVDSSRQLPFLVMPCLDCESLQERLDRDGALPLPEVLRIGLQVARGLEAAHAQGVVHRDVKPAKILLERGVERAMLTDFGLARAVDDATLTRTGLIAGTPGYMSPEQARGEPVDTRSDLFSLGSVLYAACSGRPPFRAETTYGILRRVTDDVPRPIRELNPEIPEWFVAIVTRLHCKSACDRLQSAGETAELLEKCLAHVQRPDEIALPNTVLSMISPESGASPSWWRRRKAIMDRVVMAVIVLIILLTAISTGAYLLRPADTVPRQAAIPPTHRPVEDGEDPPLVEKAPAEAHPEVRFEKVPFDVRWNDALEPDLRSLNVEIESLLKATSP